MLLWSKNLHVLEGVTPDSGQKFQVLSFDDVVFSKGGFLDDKNIMLL